MSDISSQPLRLHSDVARQRQKLFTEPNSPSNISHSTNSTEDENHLSGESTHPSSSSSKMNPDAERSRSTSTTKKIRKPSDRSSLSGFKYRWQLGLILSITLVLAAHASRMLIEDCNPKISPSMIEEVDRQISRLRGTFPDQNDRLWATLRNALLTQPRCTAKWMVFSRRESVNHAPTVLLFTPSAIGNPRYTDFLNQFATALHDVYKEEMQCHAIDPYESVPDNLPETLKVNLDRRLSEAYKDGRRCLRVPDVDSLPGEAALVLHGSTDRDNSPLRNTFILLSITDPPYFGLRESYREMETIIRKHLHSLWDASLGRDEVSALISRLTGRICIVFV